MRRRIIPLILTCVVSCWLAAAGAKVGKDPAFNQIDSIVKSLSGITGLSERHPVSYGRMSKGQLRHFLTKRIKRTLKPEEIYADELALKMLGLVPADFNLKKSTIELLTEQAAAFYDYDEKKLFLLGGSPIDSEESTLAHELAHALADQYFDLGRYMEESPSNDDENLAHTAVVEGEASWLMLAYELKEAGREPDPTAAMLKSVSDSSESAVKEYPVLSGSPLYVQQSLLFPYTEGVLFFDAVYRRMGKAAFGAVFSDAPVDSSQVIHPDRYFAHEKPSKPELPKLPGKYERKELTSGSVGEFDHQMMLRQYVGEAKATAMSPHLRGGVFKIVTAGKKTPPILEYASEWDSAESAAAFLDLYANVLRGKWRQYDVLTTKNQMLAGVGDNGYFVTRCVGPLVSSIEGIRDVDEWMRLRNSTSVPAAVHLSFMTRIERHGE